MLVCTQYKGLVGTGPSVCKLLRGGKETWAPMYMKGLQWNQEVRGVGCRNSCSCCCTCHVRFCFEGSMPLQFDPVTPPHLEQTRQVVDLKEEESLCHRFTEYSLFSRNELIESTFRDFIFIVQIDYLYLDCCKFNLWEESSFR